MPTDESGAADDECGVERHVPRWVVGPENGSETGGAGRGTADVVDVVVTVDTHGAETVTFWRHAFFFLARDSTGLMHDTRGEQAPERQTEQCAHCQYPITDDPILGEEGTERFCSSACRDAREDDEFVRDHAYKRFHTGIEPIDALVPDGIPSDAFVLLASDEGTRQRELTTELVWRALTRGEPAVVVAYNDPPTALLERFFALEWNVLPYLETDRLRIVDCFTHRLEDPDDFQNSRNDWGQFVADVADDAVIEVRDPSDTREVANTLHRALEDLEMSETGVVVMDSIDELSTLVQDRLVHAFLTDVRATVCKARFVPLFASVTTAGERSYPVGDEYIFDGIVDLRLTDHLAPDTRLSQLGIRKLTGAQFYPQWVTYAHRQSRGLFTFDPAADAPDVFTAPLERPQTRPN